MTMIPVYVVGLIEVINPSPPAVTPTAFDFYQPLSVAPKRTKANNPTAFLVYNPRPPAVTPTAYDFYNPLSLVPTRHTRSNVGPSSFLIYNPSPPAIKPTDFNFYMAFQAPPRRVKAAREAAIWFVSAPAQAAITPTQFDFYQPFVGRVPGSRNGKMIWQWTAFVIIPDTPTPPVITDAPLYAIATFAMNRGMMRG